MSYFSVLSFDILEVMSVDCLAAKPSFVQKFFFTQLLPVLLLGLIKVIERYHLRGSVKGEHRRKVKEQTLNRIFLILFLLYPQVSASVFQIFMCRDLGGGESIHLFDAALDCNSPWYQIVRVIAAVCMVIYPLGIPSVFGVLLYTNRKVLSHDWDAEINGRQFKLLVNHFLYANRKSLGSEYGDENDAKKFADKIAKTSKFSDDAIEEIFKLIDDDGSGYITQSELASFSIAHALKIEPLGSQIEPAVLSTRGVQHDGDGANTDVTRKDNAEMVVKVKRELFELELELEPVPGTVTFGEIITLVQKKRGFHTVSKMQYLGMIMGNEQSLAEVHYDPSKYLVCMELPWYKCMEGADGKAKYKFLVKSYDPGCYWFELVRSVIVVGFTGHY